MAYQLENYMQTAVKIFNRMCEVEKIQLRLATPGRIEFLVDWNYRVDFFEVPMDERIAILTETKALCDLEFATVGAHPTFGRTWNH
jgi:hypothetical protein